MTTEEEFKPLIPTLSAILSAAAVAFEGFAPAAAPISNYVRDVVNVVSMAAGKREKALDEFLQMVCKTSKKTCNCGRRGKPCTTRVDKWTGSWGEARSQVSFGRDNKMDKARQAVEHRPHLLRVWVCLPPASCRVI